MTEYSKVRTRTGRNYQNQNLRKKLSPRKDSLTGSVWKGRQGNMAWLISNHPGLAWLLSRAALRCDGSTLNTDRTWWVLILVWTTDWFRIWTRCTYLYSAFIIINVCSCSTLWDDFLAFKLRGLKSYKRVSFFYSSVFNLSLKCLEKTTTVNTLKCL